MSTPILIHGIPKLSLYRTIIRPYSSVGPSNPSHADSPENVQRHVSSVKAGTILKGLNIMAGKSDPVAMNDEDYPDWLWRLTESKIKNAVIIDKRRGGRDVVTEEKLNFGYLRTAWRAASRQKKKL
ncbi:hypothetical protein SeMB42_g04426 [Synchytrium endobioticum]|uniref:Large ribosomal subunit protein mL54 n=1 Tax=Synchytrium endobioticum TaxID=286115 RepID=A0A507CMS9_9FUNG|nr:hypothetical protein SeLEV6574_g06772 [Synchytrium endobioticum]TPX44141.1 hypothetical protein SeMB42_g04426 [Synchytrium endobioticum]